MCFERKSLKITKAKAHEWKSNLQNTQLDNNKLSKSLFAVKFPFNKLRSSNSTVFIKFTGKYNLVIVLFASSVKCGGVQRRPRSANDIMGESFVPTDAAVAK